MAHTGDVFEGRTLDAAVTRGLETLGLSRAEVMITILEEGSGGFLGLGARPYRVRVMRRPGGPPTVDQDRDERRRRGTGREPRDRGRDGRPREERRGERRDQPGAQPGAPPREERRGDGRRRDERRGTPVPAEGSGRPREERRDDRREPAREPGHDREPGRDRERGRDRNRDGRPREERRREEPAPPPAPELQREAGENGQPGGEDGEGRRRRRRGRRGGRRRHGAPEENGAAMTTAAAPTPVEVAVPPAEDDGHFAPEEPAAFVPVADERPVAEAPAVEAPREPRPEADDTPGYSGEELAAQSVRMTQELLTAMGFEAKIGATVDGSHVDVTAEVARDEELLTGPKGEVRQALQHILNRRLNRGETSRYHLQLEINDFWKRREEELCALARSLAEEALASGGEAVTEYLNAQERRIVHVTLRDDTRVKTYALGTGMIKRVAIAPAGFEGGPRDEED